MSQELTATECLCEIIALIVMGLCCLCIVSEQRVTGVLVYVMVGLSALLADLLKVMPSFVYLVFVLNTCP